MRSEPRLLFSAPHGPWIQCHQLPAGVRSRCGSQEACSGQKGSRLCPEEITSFSFWTPRSSGGPYPHVAGGD